MKSELMFEVEREGIVYTIGINKVGGGTIGSRYDCENWEWSSESDNGTDVLSDRFYVSGYADHFAAATRFLELLEEGDIPLGDDLQECVDRGVELLDSLIPKWRLLIDVEILDLGSTSKCILGQIFGGYSPGLEVLGDHNLDVEGGTYGFGGDGHYDKLTDLWKKAIDR